MDIGTRAMFVKSYYHELLSPSSVEDVQRPRPLLDHIQKDGQADCEHELDLWEAGGTRRELRAENHEMEETRGPCWKTIHCERSAIERPL